MEEQDGAAIDYREPDGLDAKIVEAFPGKTVRKDLTAVMKRGAHVCLGVPSRYVLLDGRSRHG